MIKYRGKKMKYKSVNELETISFHDAQVQKFEYHENDKEASLFLEMTGAVVKDGNSQNDFYADKYTDIMQVKFQNISLEKVLLEGHKYYDANDKLIEQISDTEIQPQAYQQLFKKFKNSYIFYGGNPSGDQKLYQIIIDVEEESYVISLRYEKVIACWDRFLNKVQNM